MAFTKPVAWIPSFSDNPNPNADLLDAMSIVELLDYIGDELVYAPTAGPEQKALFTRRELLARVLWTRAIMEADNATAKLIIEYLDGKPGETDPSAAPRLSADQLAEAEALVRKVMADCIRPGR